jgi:hypothetical protein
LFNRVIVHDSLDSITATGTVSAAPTGYMVPSSSFTVHIQGVFLNSQANGTWSISFADSTWEAWAPSPGTFNGTLTSGSGVTKKK